MSVKVGAYAPTDKIKHYYDPRNHKSNIKVTTPGSSTTTYKDMVGSNDVTVTDGSMLHTDGYVNFPVPDFQDTTLRGCEFHGEFAQQDPTNADDGLYLDFSSVDGCTFSFWIYPDSNQTFINDYASGWANNVIFGPTATGNWYKSQFCIEDGATSNPANRPADNQTIRIGYSGGSLREILPRFLPGTAQNVAANQKAEKMLAPDEWHHIVISGNQASGSTDIVHDVWHNGEKIISGIVNSTSGYNNTTDTHLILNSIGCQEDQGPSDQKPGLSFQGRMGPFAHWDKKLTDDEIQSLYTIKPNV